jgi:uncharacterized protein YndB with AHSA1/START domain
MKRDDYVPSELADVQAMPTAPATPGGGDAWTLVFVRNLDHAPSVVWAALTEPAQLDEWAPVSGRPRPGRDRSGDAHDDRRGHRGAACGDRPPGRRADASRIHLGDDVLQWELSATDGGTRLTLRHTTETRTGVPMVAAGWHMCLDVMALALDGHPIGAIRGGEALDFGWQKLHDAYANKLGITAPARSVE